MSEADLLTRAAAAPRRDPEPAPAQAAKPLVLPLTASAPAPLAGGNTILPIRNAGEIAISGDRLGLRITLVPALPATYQASAVDVTDVEPITAEKVMLRPIVSWRLDEAGNHDCKTGNMVGEATLTRNRAGDITDVSLWIAALPPQTKRPGTNPGEKIGFQFLGTIDANTRFRVRAAEAPRAEQPARNAPVATATPGTQESTSHGFVEPQFSQDAVDKLLHEPGLFPDNAARDGQVSNAGPSASNRKSAAAPSGRADLALTTAYRPASGVSIAGGAAAPKQEDPPIAPGNFRIDDTEL